MLLETSAHQLELCGNDVQAIRQMERALMLRCQIQESASDVADCLDAAERLVVKCNTVAVRSFKSDEYTVGEQLLHNALRLTEEGSQPLSSDVDRRQRLRGTTLNNFGCLGGHRGRLAEALQFMQESLS